MAAWKILELATAIAMVASMVWGVLRFFGPPSRRGARLTLVALAAVGGFLNQMVAVLTANDETGYPYLAIAMYVAALTLFWSAVGACGRHTLTAIFSTDVPSRHVTGGPYRVVRHPFYASYVLFWLAGWIGTGEWSTLGVALSMTAIYVRAAVLEEKKFAASPFAASYARHTASSGFLWPRLVSDHSRPCRERLPASEPR